MVDADISIVEINQILSQRGYVVSAKFQQEYQSCIKALAFLIQNLISLFY